MLTKVERTLQFSRKREYSLVTPCCGKRNIDGKFVNYNGYSSFYGYCHSCGVATTPPALYQDEKGVEYQWNKETNSWDKDLGIHSNPRLAEEIDTEITLSEQRFIPESTIWKYYQIEPENNLLKYLRKSYPEQDVERVREEYILGSTKDGGTVFWLINKELKIQKNKVCYYKENGKRTNRFKAPYKNEDGYYACLFGAHLLSGMQKEKNVVVLVESEKTAIIGSLLLPKFTWLAYGGLNSLTERKVTDLEGHKVLLVPDISEKAVSVACDKLLLMRSKGVKANLWDMTEGKEDNTLKMLDLYNNDLEDFFRAITF